MKSWSVTIEMKATEQYFRVVLFIMLYKVVLTFESVDEILQCDHSNESYWAVLSCSAFYYAVQGGSNFWVCGCNPKMWPFRWKLLLVSSHVLWYSLLCGVQGGSIVAFESLVSIQRYRWSLWIFFNALNGKVGRYFETVDEVLDHSKDRFNSPFRLCCYSANLSIGPSRSNPQAMNIQAFAQRFSLVLLFTV